MVDSSGYLVSRICRRIIFEYHIYQSGRDRPDGCDGLVPDLFDLHCLDRDSGAAFLEGLLTRSCDRCEPAALLLEAGLTNRWLDDRAFGLELIASVNYPGWYTTGTSIGYSRNIREV